MFKIEVFNALQTRFGPFKIYLSQKNPSKRKLKLKVNMSLGSPQYNILATRTNKRRALSLQEMELDG